MKEAFKNLGKEIFKPFLKSKELAKQGTKTVRVGNYSLTANQSHLIEVHLREHPLYSRNVARLVKLFTKKYPDLGIIDVGANIGDTVALLRTEDVNNKVYCVEGEPTFWGFLAKNLTQFQNVESFRTFLGEKTETLKLSLGTTSDSQSLDWDEHSEGIKVRRLDELSVEENFDDAKVLKIDTDGFDLKIIRGAEGLLKKSQPMIFFEYDNLLFAKNDENALPTLQMLQKLGYDKIIYYDNFGKLVTSTSLKNEVQLQQLDNYIAEYSGAFPYYDVCIFHENDEVIAEKIIKIESKFRG